MSVENIVGLIVSAVILGVFAFVANQSRKAGVSQAKEDAASEALDDINRASIVTDKFKSSKNFREKVDKRFNG